VIMVYSVATEVGRAIFNAVAEVERDYASEPTDQVDLKAVLLFVALGLSLTAAFFVLAFGWRSENLGGIRLGRHSALMCSAPSPREFLRCSPTPRFETSSNKNRGRETLPLQYVL
jgi:hypothetical protein